MVVGKQSGHGGDLSHLDRVAVEVGQHAMHPGDVAAVDQLPPAVEIAFMGRARDAFAKTSEVPLDRRLLLVEGLSAQMRRESAVQLP